DYTQGVEKSVDRVLVTLDASGKSQNRRWMVGRLPRIQPQLSTASVDDDVRVDLCRRGLSTPSTAPMNTASPSMLTRPIQSGHATFCGQPDRHVACPSVMERWAPPTRPDMARQLIGPAHRARWSGRQHKSGPSRARGPAP